MSVFITGASSGIGEACARAFAAAKHNLVLVARRKERLEALAKELTTREGVQVQVLFCDVQSQASVKKMFEENKPILQSRSQPIDVLINAAGLGLGRGPIQDGDVGNWDKMIDTNVKGLLYVTRAVLPQMVEKKKGHIVNLGSVAGQWIYPGGNIYCATKAAVRALTQALRLDLQGTGIRVTEIAPGMVETEFSEVRFQGDRDKAKAVYQGMKPLTAADIAETVLWSVQRPAHVNIQEIVIFPTAQASVEHVTRA